MSNLLRSLALRSLVALAILLSGVPAALAATTVASLTTADPDGMAWSGGTWSLTFATTNGGKEASATSNGVPFTQSYSGVLDSTGAMSVTVTDVASVIPANSVWKILVCPNLISNTTFCASLSLPITGASDDISAAVNAALPKIRIGGGHQVQGYSDAEFNATPGNMYFNVGTQNPGFRCYITGWGSCGFPTYTPSAGTGLNVVVGAGVSFCNGTVVTSEITTLPLVPSSTNYVSLNTAAACAPMASTTNFAATNFPIAVVHTSASGVSSIFDVRTEFQNIGTGGSGGGPYETITLGSTPLVSGSTVTQVTGLEIQNLSIGDSGISFTCTADPSGVAANELVYFESGSAYCDNAPAGQIAGVQGVAVAAVAAGQAVSVIYSGFTNCIADNPWVAGDLIGNPVTTAGSCHDLGTAVSQDISDATQLIGRAMQACTAGQACLMQTLGAGHYGIMPAVPYLPLTGGTLTGPVTMTGASGTFRGYYADTNDIYRWAWGASVDAEDGGNTGSSWILQAYGDNGAVGVTSMSVSRATGQVYFGVRPQFGTGTPWDSINLNLSAPPAIGAATPNSAAFTALSATSFQNTGSSTLAGTTVTTFSSSGPSSFTSSSATAFTTRPTFNTYTPWDSGNFNPANFLALSGGQMTGPLVNGAFGISATADLNLRDSGNTNGMSFFPVLATGSYNPIVVAGDAAIIGGATYNVTQSAIDIAPWSTVASGGIRVASSGVTINGATAFNTTPTAPTAATGTNTTALATTAYVMAAIGGGSSSPTFTNLALSGTLTVAGAATFNNPIYSNFSFIGSSTSTMQVPSIQISGTGNTQGIQDSGVLNANGATVLGSTLDVYGSTVLGSAGNDTTQVTGPLTALSTVTLHGYTIATLPAGVIGMTAYVTNAASCAFNTIVAGGGALFCPVIYNGSAWVGN